MLGVLAVQRGRLDAAMELIRRAIRFKPDFADAHFYTGHRLTKQGTT